MKLRLVSVGILLAACASLGFTQEATKHVLNADELKKAIPTEFFYRGQKAPVQMRNSGGFQLADGKMTLVGLVDASGYSSGIQQKYQGMLITESKLNIGGASLPPGQYGFGFAADGKFVVMNVANEDVVSVSWVAYPEMKRPVPLKLEGDGDGYKLYAGKKWVAIKPE